MGLRRDSRSAQTEIEALVKRIEKLEEQMKALRQTGTTTIQAIDTDIYADPVQGEIVIHWPTP